MYNNFKDLNLNKKVKQYDYFFNFIGFGSSFRFGYFFIFIVCWSYQYSYWVGDHNNIENKKISKTKINRLTIVTIVIIFMFSFP